MSDLIQATDIFLGFYYEKAPKNMVKKDLADMLQREFPDAPTDKEEVQNLLGMLAADPDGELSYTEFVTIVVDFNMRISKE